jgi:hypothetical protein
VGVVHARLRHPADAERRQRAQQLLGGVRVGDEVVVDEEEVAPPLAAISATTSATGRAWWRCAK